jgi:hypothetical protein
VNRVSLDSSVFINGDKIKVELSIFSSRISLLKETYMSEEAFKCVAELVELIFEIFVKLDVSLVKNLNF